MVRTNAIFPAVVRDAGTALLVATPTGRIQYANAAAHALLGRHDLAALRAPELFADAGRAAVAAFLDSLDLTAEGHSRELGPVELARSSRVVTVTGSVLRDVPRVRGLVLVLHDVTEFVAREADLARAAYTDGLTGLANRSLALRHLGAACSPTATGSVLVVDIDGFADLNNALGPHEGDRILVALARRLSRAVPRGSVVARIGGDEFLVLLPVTPLAHAEDLAQEVLGMLSLPLDIAGTSAAVTASIGVAGLAAATPEEVLTRAHAALYVSKGHGPGGVVCDGPAIRGRAVRRADLVAEVHRARSEAERARREARTDPGTGLPNRRRFDEDRETVQQRASATGRPVGVVFIDLDRFGLLNKRRGDDAGDEALARVAAILASQSRSGDTFYRKGGEEFVGLLQDTDVRAALLVAERLRAAIESARIPHGGHPSCPVLTISVGVAADVPAQRSVDQLIVAAGHEMLNAKHGGRNQVSPRLDIRPHRDRLPEPDDDDAA